MDLYTAIKKRRTVRDFTDQEVPADKIERILDAGLRGPSGNHLRDIHFVVIRSKERISEVVKMVGVHATMQMERVMASDMQGSQRSMYLDAVPKQRQMLLQASALVLPYFRHHGDFNQANGVTTYNNFASAWCAINNILLAATAEGLGCALRIPIGSEPEYVGQLVDAPEGYIMCCYLGIGYPAQDAVVIDQVPVNTANRVHFERW
ncbi:MAG: nitroreductase family protein [Symbiobacteriaceae bacterium]|nr:nitroreductase family protein [Symbiobacteriaceae bacterium]